MRASVTQALAKDASKNTMMRDMLDSPGMTDDFGLLPGTPCPL